MSATFHWIDYVVFIFSLAVSSLIGVFFAWKDRRNQNNVEFLLGSRQLGVGPVCLSLMASFLSAITVLGYPAEIYTRGAALSISILSSIVATLCAGELMLPVFYELQLTSMHMYLEHRFQSTFLRKAVSASTAFSCIIYLGVQLYAPSVAIQAVTGISVPVSMLTVGIICTFYTTIGGMKAVVWTDVVQMSLMFFGLLMVVTKATFDVGGLQEVIRRGRDGGRLNLFRMTVDPYSADSFYNCFIGMGILWFSANGMTQMQIQRYCSLPTAKKARTAVYLNMIGVAVTLTLAFGSGLAVYAYYHGCDPVQNGFIKSADQVMPYFVQDRLRVPGITGLFVSAVFAGSLSTLSSGLNSMSACIWEDFLSPILPKNIPAGRITLFTKFIAMTLGTITIGFGFISAYVGNILQASLGIAAAIVGPSCAVYLLGVTMPFVNTVGICAGFVCSISVCIWCVIAKLIYPSQMFSLTTLGDHCNKSFTGLAISTVTPNDYLFQQTPILESIQPQGFEHLYHLHPYVMPTFGLFLTISVSIVVSIFTGGNRRTIFDSKLCSPTCYRLFNWTPPLALDVTRWFTSENDIKLEDPNQLFTEKVPLRNH